VRGIGLVNDLTLEQFDEFSASVEIQDDALPAWPVDVYKEMTLLRLVYEISGSCLIPWDLHV
jgi:hypothetical protein